MLPEIEVSALLPVLPRRGLAVCPAQARFVLAFAARAANPKTSDRIEYAAFPVLRPPFTVAKGYRGESGLTIRPFAAFAPVPGGHARMPRIFEEIPRCGINPLRFQEQNLLLVGPQNLHQQFLPAFHRFVAAKPGNFEMTILKHIDFDPFSNHSHVHTHRVGSRPF
jgi:hypothetical protein